MCEGVWVGGRERLFILWAVCFIGLCTWVPWCVLWSDGQTHFAGLRGTGGKLFAEGRAKGPVVAVVVGHARTIECTSSYAGKNPAPAIQVNIWAFIIQVNMCTF